MMFMIVNHAVKVHIQISLRLTPATKAVDDPIRYSGKTIAIFG